MSQAKIWYVVIDGKADGPHTEDLLKDWIRSGKISYSDLVFRQGLARWVTAAECKEFDRRGQIDFETAVAVRLDTPQKQNEKAKVEKAKSENAKSDPVQSGPQSEESPEESWVALVKHAQVDGKNHYIQSGPFSTEQVKEKLKQGAIKYEDHVWKKGFKTWTVISSLPDFDRRLITTGSELPPTPDTEPTVVDKVVTQDPVRASVVKVAPAPSPFYNEEVEPDFHSDTNITNIFAKTKSKDRMPEALKAPQIPPTAPTPVAPKTEESVTLFDHEEAEDAADTETTVPGRRFNIGFKQRVGISLAGGALAVVVALAGIKAYNESKSKSLFKSGRNVASERQLPLAPPPPPTVVPPTVTQAQSQVQAQLPSGAQQAAAVAPEMEHAIRPANTLRVVPLKGSSRPQLAFETDAPGGTELNVEITAAAGSILQYPSFYLKKKVVVMPGQMPTLDLDSDKLPAGTYHVVATGGNLNATTQFAVGAHDSEFKQKLAEFRKIVTKKQKEERTQLSGGLDFVTKSFGTFAADYKKTRSMGTPDARKQWNQSLRKWRKDYDKELRAIKTVTEANRNRFAYPEQLIKLKETQKKLLEVSKIYDRSVKNERSVASDNNQEDLNTLNDLKTQVKALKREVKHLK